MNWLEEQAKHYANIRNDPMYRLQEKLADMECMMEPGHWPVEREPDRVGTPEYRIQPRVIYQVSTEMTRGYKDLWENMYKLKGQLHKYLERPTKKKRTYNTYE